MSPVPSQRPAFNPRGFAHVSSLIAIAVLLLLTRTQLAQPLAAQENAKQEAPKADAAKGAAKQETAKQTTGKADAAKADTTNDAAKASAKAPPQKLEYKLPEAISQLLQDRNYKAAIAALDEAAKPAEAQRDYLLFLKARAQHLSGAYDDAVKIFEQVEKEFPKSPWATRARFAKAVAFARKGDFQTAEKLYKAEATKLLSLDRKQEIAEIYLEFAETYFKPKDEITQQPNYNKALEFYRQALVVGPKPDKIAEIELRIARCLQLLNNAGEAIQSYQNYLTKHKLDLKTAEAPAKQREIEARFRLGEIHLTAGQPVEARRAWQDLLALFPDEKHDHLPQAAFNLSQTHGLPAPANKEDLNLGIAALEKFLKKYGDNKLAPAAHLRIAQSYLHANRPADAVKALDAFLADARYNDKDEQADARNLLGRAYQLQKKFPQALAAWRLYLTKHPSHSAWSDVQRGIIDTEFLMAEEQRVAKNYDEARKLWNEFLVKYPLDERNPRIMYAFGLMNYDQQKWDDAVTEWRRLVTKYPQANESSQAQFMIANLLETKLGKLDDALKEYKKVTWGAAIISAKQAIGRLTAKHLQIATERVFRSNETPTIKLQSRNLETVTVRCYRIDLETYFRKMHLIQGIEGLDIALIDPDKTFEYKIPKYAEYQLLENGIEVPLPALMDQIAGPTSGAMAVTISSKTLEATTLVLQSDLDMIVKSSRDEVLVFAQNLRTGKPWPQAKLLFSNGGQVFGEGETDANGIFRGTFKELKEAPQIRVYASSAGHSASNHTSLNGIGAAVGLADTGYIYTDRPAYRAGQVVHVRGVLRRAINDEYVIEKDKKFTLEILDPRNRSIWVEELKLSTYGGLRSLFTLPPTSPSGQYRIVVRDLENHAYAGAFIVQDYTLEPIQLKVETDRHVYYRGEEVKGKIVAKYYYGAPLADKEIRYKLADGKVETARTDAKGEIAFTFPTRDYRETQMLPLTVTLAERNLSIVQNFVLAAQGFSLQLSTVRQVFISGESFELTTKALDAENKPLAQKLTLTVLEQTVVNGRVGETEVEKHDLQTDVKDGTVRKTLKLAKGGTYILRVEGIDRFDNPITGLASVTVSDDKDAQRLRILADKHTFEVGQEAVVQIHWRDEPALALVTFQGARILDYKLVELKQGANEFKIPLTAKLAPNFDLSISLMRDVKLLAVANDKLDNKANYKEIEKPAAGLPEPAKPIAIVRFHEAVNSFVVQRKLNVTVETKRKGNAAGPIRPGDEVDLIIKTTDALGIPVSAELSVAMVEQSLLAIFGSQVPPIQESFMGVWRASAMRSGSSIEFGYRPQTRPIDKQLLAEVERRELEAEENARREAGLPFGAILVQEFVAVDNGVTGFGDAANTWSSNVDGTIVAGGGANQLLIINNNDVDRVIIQEEQEIGLHFRGGGQGGGNADGFGQNAADPFGAPQGGQSGGNGNARYNNRGGMGGGGGQQLIFNNSIANVPGLQQNQQRLQVQQQLAGGSGEWKYQANLSPQAQTANGGNFNRVLGFSLLGNTTTQSIRRSANVNGPNGPSSVLGLDANGNPTAGLNVEFRQGLFNQGSFSAANSSNFYSNIAQGNRDVVMVNPTNGEQWNLNFRNTLGTSFTVAMVDDLGKKLTAGGNLMVQQSGPQETGYWNPVVVTDEKGQAQLTITMPDQSTAWKLTTRGVSVDTLAGEADTELTVKKDLFGELKLPAAFTDGDEVELPALIHNDLLDKGNITVTLKTVIGGKLVEEKKTVAVTAKGIQEVTFKTSLRRPAPDANNAANAPQKIAPDAKNDKETASDPLANVLAAFELTVTVEVPAKAGAAAEKVTDTLRRVAPVLPYGVPVYAVTGGTAGGDTTVWIEAPAGATVQNPHLQLILGSSIDRGLLDILLGPPVGCHLDVIRSAPGIDVTTSDLMAALALQKLFDKSRDSGAAQSQALDARVRSCLSQLVTAQLEDGGWSWTGHGKEGHRFTTARVFWSLTLAGKAGYKVSDEAISKARAYLQTQITAVPETDYETKAVLLHALSTAGQGDFALANRLHRNKAALSPTALVYTALAFVEMDRNPVANELLSSINNEAALVDLPTRRGEARGVLPWSASGAELRALQALALARIAPEDPKLKQQIDWLMAHRSGHRWSPEKATGPAALAVCGWYAKQKFETEKYTLKIFVNDLLVKELTVDKNAETQIIDVPDRILKPGKQRIQLQLTGRGQFTYQAVLAGFVPADKLTNSTKDWHVTRVYEPAPLELDGLEIPRGFDVLQGSYSHFRNPLTQLPVGRRGHIELQIGRINVPANTPEDQLEYLVVTEPLPCGVSVVESSIKGGFERFELSPGAITFYIGTRQYIEGIRFDVHGYLPGKYRAAPTMVRNTYKLDQLAVSAQRDLTVLPFGTASSDEYKLTPRELFEFGKRHFAKKNFKAAQAPLTELFSKWNLNPATYQETVKLLLDAHLVIGPPGDVVRYFEIIKEKYPEEEIPFDKIMQVASAYDQLGEYERSYMVYRAIVENSFLRENSVAGYLENQGEFLRSVDVMQRLLAEYPPEPYAAAVQYALAQRVYAYAPKAADDPKLREKKINKVTLIQQALGMLDNFLTMYPDDPAADQAAFSLANALLELQAHKELVARATKYAERYPTSDYLDSYWYLVAYGHFALHEHDAALQMARKVAESKRIDKATGREIESPNKWQAIYILGQVYHSLGKAGEAVAEYLKVEDRFTDAKQAIAYFLRKEIKLPEVTTLKPADQVAVELTFRNIPTIDLKVYRIDLMKFSLLKRNLGGITQINLAGIRPSHEETLKLGDGKDYRDRLQKLNLQVKEEGAYLVVARGENLHASGLVLISPLAVDVQEEPGSGRVRVTVKDVTADKYVSQVQAKVIGSRNGEFVSGLSDLRGVFIADGIAGTSTVIAQADDGRYAFFRGITELGPPPQPDPNAPAANEAKPGQQPGEPQGKDGVLIEQLQRGNRMLQEQQKERLDNNYKMNNEGVKAKAAF